MQKKLCIDIYLSSFHTNRHKFKSYFICSSNSDEDEGGSNSLSPNIQPTQNYRNNLRSSLQENVSLDSDDSFFSYSSEGQTKVETASTARARSDLKLIFDVEKVSPERRLSALTKLLDDVANDKSQSLAAALCNARGVKSVDIFDVFNPILRHCDRRCLETYLELLSLVVVATDQSYENYVSKRIREEDLMRKLFQLCSSNKSGDNLSEEDCEKINKKLTECARMGSLTG
jgi:hypothetical protein